MAISYTFNATQIHLFEFNVLPGLLTSPKKTIQNPDFGFLANKANYNLRQESDALTKTENFLCQRFSRRTMSNSSLWKRYTETVESGNAVSWDLQIPFVLRLRKHNMEVLALPENARKAVKVDSYILINALGWSTHVNIVLNTPLKPSQIADLCSNLRDKAYGPPSYRLNGMDMTLKEVFRYYRKLLMTDILFEEVQYARPDHIPHMIFVDVIRAVGSDPVPFYELPTGFIQVLARIIKRNAVQVRTERGEIGTFPVIDDMLITEIDPEFYNFSLTDFNQGVFTFMQVEAANPEKSSLALCLAKNTRDAFLISYLWLEAYHRLSEKAKNKPAIKKLFAGGSQALLELRKTYSSRTSLRLLQKHKGLVAFLEQDTVKT